jgi:hypothetical protein
MIGVWIALGSFLVLLGLYRLNKWRARQARRGGHYWSVGYQRSSDPFTWDPTTAKVLGPGETSEPVHSLADPFLLQRNGDIYLFCEVSSEAGGRNQKIGVCTLNRGSDTWNYEGIVLDEPFHLSYPFVFEHDGQVYMIPESKQANSIRLYRATEFPHKWELERVLVDGWKLVDSCVVPWEDKWYLFTSRKRWLVLLWADSLTGRFRLHPKSPIKWWNHARSAGGIIEHGGKLHRFAQEQTGGYGKGVHAYRILELSEKRYKEEPIAKNPILKPWGTGWANMSMHHISVLKLAEDDYFAVFDGEHCE